MEIEGLIKRIEALERKVGQIVDERDSWKQGYFSLEKENILLKERLSKYETPKNSRNSSVPPSKDQNRPPKTKSLREKSNKKVGGQPGHKGSTLKMTENPDKIVEHVPCYCNCCGKDLSDLPFEVVGRRQVIDIPPIKPEYTEHRICKRVCGCGQVIKSGFPQNVKTPVGYGPRVESLIGYWHSRQYVPFDRMKEVFTDVFSLPVSEGGLHHILNRLCSKALPAYEMIKGEIANSEVVGTDETGMKIDGKNHWFWTWQNEKSTFIAASNNRGFKTIEENFGQKLDQKILVHDCWRTHFKTGANHQLCLAHLFRELKFLTERYKDPWAARFEKLLKKAIGTEKQMDAENYRRPYAARGDIEDNLDELLTGPTNEKHKELVKFKKRMLKYRDYLLLFMYHPSVPSDNNGSERAIRTIKVKQKVSGQFKSMAGARQFAILRSITDTTIKNGGNVLNSLYLIAQLKTTD